MGMYYLYQFAEKPPAKSPAGMNQLVAHGFYLSPETAMKYTRKRATATIFNSSKPTTHLGLYDHDGNLVQTAEYKP